MILRLKRQRGETDHADHDKQTNAEPSGISDSLPLQSAFGFPVQPARAQQRISDNQSKAGQYTERRKPFPPSASIGATLDRDPLQQGAQRNALRKGGNERTRRKCTVPKFAMIRVAPAEFKGDAAEHQSQ